MCSWQLEVTLAVPLTDVEATHALDTATVLVIVNSTVTAVQTTTQYAVSASNNNYTYLSWMPFVA